VIALLRVDNRLLHGQVLETWIPRLAVTEVVVADDEAAESPLARAAMTLCVPPELRTRIVPVAAVPWAELAAASHAVLVIVRDVSALSGARTSGLVPAFARVVNLGNVHFGPGRRPVTPSVFLSAEELDAVRALAQAGFEVQARAIPSDAPTGMDEIERRYAAAR
jgi:PTS system mannose-specific IIB component